MSDRELDSRLDQIDTRQRRLAAAVDDVLTMVHGNASAIDAAERTLRGQLTSMAQTQEQTIARLDEFDQNFSNFVEQDRRDKERLFAHSMLITVRAEIKNRFGQNEDVRRNVRGMLLALDAGLAQDETMQLIAETQSINAPSYWLASAQNALAAWIRDDRGAAERALLHASSCSPGKTALFFGLLNARFGRFNATDKWFREYLRDQNPEEMPREFTVVLDAAMLGLLGDTTFERVNRQCHAWFEQLSIRNDMVGQQVARWQLAIADCGVSSGLVNMALRDRCQVLANLSPDWSQITEWYRDATAFGPMKEKLSAHLDLPRTDESAWRDRIDAMLRELHTIHEPEESALRHEEAKLLRIIDYEGDKVAAARAQAAEALVDEPQVDLLTFLTNVALLPWRLDVSQETTQLAIYHAAPWIRQAAENIVAESKRRSTEPVAIEVDGWSGELGPEPMDAVAKTFCQMVDGQTKEHVARARFGWPRLVTAFLAAGFLGLMILALTGGEVVRIWPVVVSGSLAVAFSLAAVVAHRRIPKRAGKAMQRGEQRKKDGLAALSAAEAEREKLLAVWNEHLREAANLHEFVNSIVLPELRRRAPDRWSSADGLPIERGTEMLAPSPRSRSVDRSQPSFVEQRDWSLEPVGAGDHNIKR